MSTIPPTTPPPPTTSAEPPHQPQPQSSSPPPPPPQRGFPTWAKVVLFALFPILLAVVLVITVLSAIVPPSTSTNEQRDLDAGAGVSVSVRNATLDFVPSDDGQVHVERSGFSWGNTSSLETDDSGPITQISGGCRGGLFSMCRMALEVALPADLPLLVRGTNGKITVDELTGDLDLETSNGAVEVSDSAGRLDVRTTNGSITLDDSASGRVDASTTNGAVDLQFSSAPRTVTASSTNGAITILVPDDGEEYQVSADTINGRVNTDTVPADNDSARALTARTTNGAVTIEVDD
jgi:hypothetical protein